MLLVKSVSRCLNDQDGSKLYITEACAPYLPTGVHVLVIRKLTRQLREKKNKTKRKSKPWDDPRKPARNGQQEVPRNTPTAGWGTHSEGASARKKSAPGPGRNWSLARKLGSKTNNPKVKTWRRRQKPTKTTTTMTNNFVRSDDEAWRERGNLLSEIMLSQFELSQKRWYVRQKMQWR